MLKKEFNRKDVERMRNLITGKANSSSDLQVGYKKRELNTKREIFGLKIEKHGLLKMV